MSKRITSRDVDCAVCGARKGERCRGSAYSGRSARTVDYHTARRTAARSATPDPVDDHYATAAAILARDSLPDPGWCDCPDHTDPCPLIPPEET